VWMGPLHLSPRQIANMPQGVQTRMSEWISYGRTRDKSDMEALTAYTDFALDLGINTFSGVLSHNGGFWDGYYELFPYSPTLDDLWTRMLSKSNGKPVAISFEQFERWANILPGHRSSQFKEYLVTYARTIRAKGEPGYANSMEEVLRYHWRFYDFNTQIAVAQQFGILVQDDGTVYVDEGGRPFIVICPNNLEEDDRIKEDIFFPEDLVDLSLIESNESIAAIAA